MADIHGGRVLAGEDSEDDDEDDEAYSFQFSGFGSQGGASVSAPRFSVPSVVVAPHAGGEESDEEEDEEEKESEGASGQAIAVAAQPASADEDNEEDQATATAYEQASDTIGVTTSDKDDVSNGIEGSESSAAATKLREEKAPSRREEGEELWTVEPAMDGVQMMGDAFVRSIQPALDASIQRIEELRSNQKRLLQLLVEQNAAATSNKQIEDAAVVLDKLPHYFTKIQMIRAAMAEISASTDKMKRRAESLRIDAQSHALKKENKRDAQSQWNKLVAKSAPPSSASEDAS